MRGVVGVVCARRQHVRAGRRVAVDEGVVLRPAEHRRVLVAARDPHDNPAVLRQAVGRHDHVELVEEAERLVHQPRGAHLARVTVDAEERALLARQEVVNGEPARVAVAQVGRVHPKDEHAGGGFLVDARLVRRVGEDDFTLQSKF